MTVKRTLFKPIEKAVSVIIQWLRFQVILEYKIRHFMKITVGTDFWRFKYCNGNGNGNLWLGLFLVVQFSSWTPRLFFAVAHVDYVFTLGKEKGRKSYPPGSFNTVIFFLPFLISLSSIFCFCPLSGPQHKLLCTGSASISMSSNCRDGTSDVPLIFAIG